MNPLLRQHLSQCASFTTDEFERIESHLEVRNWPKKTLLLEAGKVCHFEGFIQEGCVKVYFLDPNGHEVILYFATEGWWVSDVKSFHEGSPSRLYIETLEPTTLCCMDLTHKNQLMQEIPALERVFRLMVQNHLASLQDRIY